MSEFPDYSRDLGCGEGVRKMRDDLFERLGYIVVAERHLPPLLTQGLYDKTLDKARQLTEEDIAINQAQRDGYTRWGNIEIEDGSWK